jgi:CBS domain-containing protein
MEQPLMPVPERFTMSSLALSGGEHSLQRPLASLIRRLPVVVGPDEPLRQALVLMSEAKIGSIVVTDAGGGKPLGVFTLRDLLVRVALDSCNLEQPIRQVMSDGDLVTLKGQATGYQAGLLMARHGVHRVLVVDDDGRLLGLVSQGDLFALERAGVQEISGEIRSARDLATLQHAAAETRRLAGDMLEQGLGAEPLTHFISTLNDLLTIRIIELTATEFELPQVEWCWLAFGSEGRFEQTFSTDQDNGLIFAAAGAGAAEIEALRQLFLPFAKTVNERLDACGFPLCQGKVMASNPELCLSLEEWQGKFSNWLHAAVPQALLNATIYFDFRPLFGADALAEALSRWLLGHIAGASLFLRFMADNALRVRLPLGIVRDFAYDESKEFPHTIDLKASGSRPFVDAARIFALATGVPQTGTAQRLRAVADKMRLGGDDVAAIIEGFYFIQLLRLRNQRGAAGTRGANRIDPAKINELDRHILKEAFRQARKLQRRLQLDYRL